jgi:hypothetical protein
MFLPFGWFTAHERHSPHEGGGHEAGEIADDAAAEGHEGRCPVQSDFQGPVVETLRGPYGLGFLPVGDHLHRDFESRFG